MRILKIAFYCKLSKSLNILFHVRVVFAYLLVVYSVNGNTNTLTRIVHTRYGKMQGIVKSVAFGKHLKPVELFLGVPYATSPTGSNRFSPTRALTPWEGIKVFNTFGSVCPQWLPDISNETEALERMPKGRLEHLKRLLPFLRNQSEDCLYLNIYAPSQGNVEKVEQKYPVIVYIHGESYNWNSGNPYDGRILASYTDLIVITLNYRLGVLGFLNTNSEPNQKARVANYGLMDQIAALHWVQQNIGHFGGDPKSITLMGHGTGAACINFLMISPAVMPGLFHRAILLSGSALSSWALVEEPVVYSLEIANQVNCSVGNEDFRSQERIIDCLREVPIANLMKAKVMAPTFLNAFGPSVDGVVIKNNFQDEMLASILPEWQNFPKSVTVYTNTKTRDSKSLINTDKYDLLFGCVTSEALWRFSHNDIQSGFEGDRRDRLLRTYIRNTYSYHLSEIFFTVVNEYTDWERTVLHPINTRDSTIAALSDAQFVAPIVQTGDLFSKPPSHVVTGNRAASRSTKTFFYVFDYQTKNSDYPQSPYSKRPSDDRQYVELYAKRSTVIIQLLHICLQKMGTVHGEELSYVFGAPLTDFLSYFPRNFTKPEVTLSEIFMIYLGNFARMGNPNEFSRQESLSQAMSKERNRIRGLTWAEYDPYIRNTWKLITKKKSLGYLKTRRRKLNSENNEFANVKGLKPRIKNHFRAHQLSVWLRLIPELHRAGMEDVSLRHNMFRNHEGELYDGLVKTEQRHLQQNVSYRRPFVSSNSSVVDIIQSITTLEPFLTTCVNVPSPFANSVGSMISANATDAISVADSRSLTSYSATLGLTIAIGCTLLVLNVLIFAGVYYQRDKARMEIKSLHEQQMQNQQKTDGHRSSSYGPSKTTTLAPSCGSVILDLESDVTTPSSINVKNGTTFPRAVQHVYKYPSSNFAMGTSASLPRHMLPIKTHITNNDQSTPLDGRPLHSFCDHHTLSTPSNGSVIIPSSSLSVLPKPPPPPRSSPPVESQTLLHNTLTTNSSVQPPHHKNGMLGVPTAAINEMRV